MRPLPASTSALPSERDRAVLRGFASRVDPNDAGAHNNLGVLYYNKGMLDESVTAFMRALSVDPRMTTAERNLHIAWRETGLFDQFVANLSSAIERDPADRDSRRWLADGLLLAGDAASAVPHYESLARQSPDDPYPLGQLARACKRLGDLESADRWVKRALEVQPDDDALRLLLAELNYHRGLSDDSLATLRDLAARRPDDADVQYLLGFVLGDLGHHAEGAEAARRALRLNPSLARAEANLAIDRRPGLIDTVQEPEPSLVQGSALAHYNLGLAFRQKNYHALALKEYALALQHGEDRALVTQAMAEVHLLRQDGPAAAQLYEQLVTEQSESPKLWNERGVALHQSGRASDALASYERAVSVDPDYALALNNLGVARFHAGRDDLAVDAFRRALTVQPSFIKARLNLALLLLKRREFPLCLEAFRQVLRIEAEHPVAWNGVGLVLAEMRQFEDARNAFGRAIDARPDYAEAHYNLSFTLSNLGDFAGALRETKRALELDPYYVAQKFELAIDLEYENPRVTVSPDLDGDRREAAVREFTLDVGQLESLFDRLAPVPERAAASVASPYAIATAALNTGDLDRATNEIRIALESGADRAAGLSMLGDVFIQRGAYGEALDRYRQARQLDQQSLPALAGEVRAMVLLGRGAQALDLAEALALKAPQDVEALLLVARARSDAGALERAQTALDAARKLAPARADVLKQVGDVARAMGDQARAIQAYRQAIALDGDFIAARLDLAAMYVVHGATDQAELELVAALASSPSNVDAALQLAALRRSERRAADSIDLLVTVLQRDPWNLDALASLGESLFLTGRRDDAQTAFARVLRFDPDHVGALYFDGVLLAEARQFDAALDRWSAVIALEPAGDFARRARRDTRIAVDLQRIFASREARVMGAA